MASYQSPSPALLTRVTAKKNKSLLEQTSLKKLFIMLMGAISENNVNQTQEIYWRLTLQSKKVPGTSGSF